MLTRLLTFVICLLFLSSIANAWLAGYGYRKQFTVQGTNLSSNQTHFPIYLKLVDSDIDDHCDDDGDRSFDIRFTQSDDTVLDVDWIDYSEAGGDATIICVFSDAGWTINANGTTTGYLYYGNAAAGDPATDTGVWDANYEVVYHMMNATDTTVADSTSHGSTGTKQAIGAPTEVAGKLNLAQSFDADHDYIVIGAGYNTDAFTIEMIISPDVTGGGKYVADSDPSNKRAVFYDFQVDFFNIFHNGAYPTGNAADTQIAATESTWQHIAYTTDGTDLYGYKNGAEVFEELGEDLDVADMTGYWIGAKSTDSNEFGGDIEEFRISSSIRSAHWFEFQWANYNEADNELTWGAEQEPPADGFVPKVIIIR